MAHFCFAVCHILQFFMFQPIFYFVCHVVAVSVSLLSYHRFRIVVPVLLFVAFWHICLPRLRCSCTAICHVLAVFVSLFATFVLLFENQVSVCPGGAAKSSCLLSLWPYRQFRIAVPVLLFVTFLYICLPCFCCFCIAICHVFAKF